LNLSRFKKGESVASEDLTIVDDGLYPYGLRTEPFDDEGQPQRKTPLISKGVFKNYLYDQLHAQMMQGEPTGNGIRTGFGIDVDERYQTVPTNDTTNLSFNGGDQSLEELVQDTKNGLIIYQAAWLNPDRITTRFGSEIRNAQRIKDGELVEGVVGGSLSGSTFELVKQVSGLSDQPEVVSGYAFGCVAPYVRFENVQISGSG
jgi:predicted Zn-dependent protease